MAYLIALQFILILGLILSGLYLFKLLIRISKRLDDSQDVLSDKDELVTELLKDIDALQDKLEELQTQTAFLMMQIELLNAVRFEVSKKSNKPN
jgi:cell division protein FtsB